MHGSRGDQGVRTPPPSKIPITLNYIKKKYFDLHMDNAKDNHLRHPVRQKIWIKKNSNNI